ncbi:hypothetical protein LshimejAT787_0104840 [Lyophyllum shimeji]|uniref:Uncharacterized protein n=1 Tax=Lyophyllum shimeji TaxID=47721 RepID=A0A9P3PCT0_LYOSH|nr:hypothetical protein LshimejAT787_0104840 [Lyophyllum shimeji]
MTVCSLSYHALAPVFHSVTRNSPRGLLRASSRFSTTLSLSSDLVDAPPAPEPPALSPRAYLRERKFLELQDSLNRGGGPSRVWAYYTDLLNVLGYEKLPLEVHQAVLRRCTPPTAELRVSAAKRLLAGNRTSTPHIHEGRFQTIIRNIRALDQKPELDDYHFILEQFAAVGHHVGAMEVYKELTSMDVTPRTKTFGLCFQALAHCLTLPVPKQLESHRIAQTRSMLANLIADMQKLRIPFTSANLDLTIRILKENMDMETFEKLMKWGYGIDLSNPDRPPVEFLGSQTIRSDLGMAESVISGLPAPQPFSTAGLNTTLDILGRFGNVSKLIQTFEVLTAPLPRASQHMFSSFDDDDDFGVVESPVTLPHKPPHAYANITTYNTLLRHLCKAGHATLARHYLLEAIYFDTNTDMSLRRVVYKMPVERIYAPHFAINRGTLLPVFGESNRDKNHGLMRWLSTKIPGILKRKRQSLQYFTEFKKWLERGRSEKQTTEQSTTEKAVQANPTEVPSTSSSRPASRLQKSQTDSVFDVDLDAPPIPTPPPPKYFDINLHLRILERDIREIEAFAENLERVRGRNLQRLKERLGRRVWAGKDVWLSVENRRRKVTREEWQKIVGFKPRRSAEPSQRTPSVASIPTNRPASTFFQSNYVAPRQENKDLENMKPSRITFESSFGWARDGMRKTSRVPFSIPSEAMPPQRHLLLGLDIILLFKAAPMGRSGAVVRSRVEMSLLVVMSSMVVYLSPTSLYLVYNV